MEVDKRGEVLCEILLQSFQIATSELPLQENLEFQNPIKNQSLHLVVCQTQDSYKRITYTREVGERGT